MPFLIKQAQAERRGLSFTRRAVFYREEAPSPDEEEAEPPGTAFWLGPGRSPPAAPAGHVSGARLRRRGLRHAPSARPGIGQLPTATANHRPPSPTHPRPSRRGGAPLGPGAALRHPRRPQHGGPPPAAPVRGQPGEPDGPLPVAAPRSAR